MGKDINKTRQEFIAIVLTLAVVFPFLLAPTVILIIATNPSNATSQFNFLVLYFAPQLIAVITGAIMGLEVNRKVKRVDMLQDGIKNFMVIWKAYYHEIAKQKRFPVVLVIFVSSTALVAVEYLWILYRSKGILGLILLFIVIALLIALGHFSKKYNIQSLHDKK